MTIKNYDSIKRHFFDFVNRFFLVKKSKIYVTNLMSFFIKKPSLMNDLNLIYAYLYEPLFSFFHKI